jgi:hypothetical protein
MAEGIGFTQAVELNRITLRMVDHEYISPKNATYFSLDK